MRSSASRMGAHGLAICGMLGLAICFLALVVDLSPPKAYRMFWWGVGLLLLSFVGLAILVVALSRRRAVPREQKKAIWGHYLAGGPVGLYLAALSLTDFRDPTDRTKRDS